MRPARSVAVAAVLLAGACTPEVSGVVRDASTEAPVAGAVVELGNVGWGTRDGQVVWDAAKTARTTTDTAGKFVFAEGGGTSLRVAAPGRAPIETSLCPRSPSLVRVGGPCRELRADTRLVFAQSEAGGQRWYGNFGLSASGSAFDAGQQLSIESAGGVRFVAGTGAVPPAPALPYATVAELDLAADCGWLFVADGTMPVAVVQVGPLGWEQDSGGPRRYVMLFARLPRPRPAAPTG